MSFFSEPFIATANEVNECLTTLIDERDIEEVVSLITDPKQLFSWGMIVYLATKNPAINALCESNPALNQFWAQRLAEKKYIDYSVTGTQGDVHSVFKRYKGAWIWGEYNRQKNARDNHRWPPTLLLDMACQCHVYSAWVEKTDRIRAALKNSTGDAERSSLLEQLNKTLTGFCEAWWSVGYINAAMIWMDTADFFHQQGDRTSTSVYLESAIKTFYVGFYLIEHPISAQIINSLYPENGWAQLFAAYAEGVDIKDTHAVKNKIIDALSQNFSIHEEESNNYLPHLEASAAEESRAIIERFDRATLSTPDPIDNETPIGFMLLRP